MTTLSKTCLFCHTEITVRLADHKRGLGKYCSNRCSSRHIASQRSPKDPNTTCAFCGNLFYKKPSARQMSKSGLYFCSRSHKDLAQRIGGIEAIQPTHYGTASGERTYRILAFSQLPHCCARCGYNEVVEVLQAHHKNGDRTNNGIENLEILCPTCHMVFHFQQRSGLWRNVAA